jgi:HPt (histidine-containing phosphotransfer) domain-containing protein
MEELWSRFRDRFLASTEQRLHRARELLESGNKANGARIASELHALAGEAGLLGVGEVSRMARAGESVAKSWSVAADEVARDHAAAFARMLDDLDNELKALKG